MPKVSVLTPIYNTDPAQLEEMIQSILNQTFRDFEFIILNDSPDNLDLEKLVLNFDDPRIKYYKNETNLGISESRNKLIGLAKGEYLAVCDHDDISVPTRLQMQVEYLDSHIDVGVISGLCDVFGGGSHSFQKYPENDFEIKLKLLFGCYVTHPACMIRKEVLIKNNIKYNSYYSPAEDYKLFLDLIPYTSFYILQKVVLHYRSYEGNTTVIQQSRMEKATDLIQAEAREQYSYLYKLALRKFSVRLWKYKLFNFIPLITIYSDKVTLFDSIQIFKIKRY